MRKKKITRQLNFRIYKDLYGKPCKRDWVAKVVFLIQMLLTFGGRCNRYFWDIRLKILRLPNFNMLFQLVLTKFFKRELFLCYRKLITWSSHAKSLFDSKYRSEVVCWRNSKKVCSYNLHKKQCAHPLINTQRFMSVFENKLIFKQNLSTG